MQDATAGSHDAPTAGYSLQEAAASLGIGINTLRRRIAAGLVRAEQVERPQGYVWRVYLDGRHPPMQPTSDPTDRERLGSLPRPPAPLAQAEALAALIQATLTPIIAPLVAEQAALRQTVERQATQLVGQAERLGRQGAELERATSTVVALGDELAATEASRRRDARLLIAGAVLLAGLALVAGVFAAMAWLP